MDVPTVVVVFATLVAVILAPIAKSIVAFTGLLVAVLLSPTLSLTQLASAVDWNVLAVLLGTWVIINYMLRSNLPSYVAYQISVKVRSLRLTLLVLTVVAGLVSTFLANVQVVLLFAPVAMTLGRIAGLDPLKVSMVVALAANYMGTALMLGDLPPLLLHSVAGAEFFDYIWFKGRPGSFPLLITSFLATTALFYRHWFSPKVRNHLEDTRSFEKPVLMKVPAVASAIALTVLAILAAVRPIIGLPLGALAMVVALLTAAALEVLRTLGLGRRVAGFDEVLKDIEWEALAFYAALFGLTKALDAAGFFEEVSLYVVQLVKLSTALAYSSLYWVTAGLSMLIEHDALLLVLLYVVRDAAKVLAFDPWPYYWGLAWSATLGSNATIAAAPTLYLALILAEKYDQVRRSWRDWLGITLPFTLVSLVVHFTLTLPFFTL
jgi:Na+/H+ antiporter NhaD/arsenite permease-like protein